MRPRVKSSLLWGLVGALSFLVLAQGYRLVTDRGVGLPALLVVAVVVAVAATAASYLADGWATRKRRV
ncbi:hypothetical protein ACFQH6_18380 [Halobacteriaceae archaeon GCM10025711]